MTRYNEARYEKLRKKKGDKIIYIDIGEDLNIFEHIVYMFGTNEMQTKRYMGYFVANVFNWLNEFTHTTNTVNRVVGRVESSIQRENTYGRTSGIEVKNKIIDAWLNMCEHTKDIMREYIMDSNGKRNDLVATYSTHNDLGIVTVILHVNDEDEDECED